MKIVSVDRPAAPPLEMPARFRQEVVYFMTPAGSGSAPAELGTDEYWVDASEARRWLDDLVISIVSPLDAEAKAEIELTDDHERFLEWLLANETQHIRLERP
jgi:hypothetical protein